MLTGGKQFDLVAEPERAATYRKSQSTGVSTVDWLSRFGENDAIEGERKRMMTFRRKQIRDLVAQLFDAEPCADELLNYIERSAPALLYFIEHKAAGRLSTARAAFLDFLRWMPEPLFDYLLVRALDFFRRPAPRLEAIESQDPELASLAFVIWLDEQGLDTYRGTNSQLYALITRFANLILLEEQERAGAGVWLAHYPMLLRDGAVGPLRFPILEWLMPH